MQIVVGRYAGFCFGVNNALEMAQASAKDGPVCTLGALIHNQEVVDALKRQGIEAVDQIERVQTPQVVIRSHGARPETFERLRERGLRVIDATCPYVKRIHRLAQEAQKSGQPVVILGEKTHPEIQATEGWAGERCFIVDSEADVDALPSLDSACVIGQTTYSTRKRDLLLERIKQRIPKAQICEFICPTTEKRQSEARELAAASDVMLVVGDPHSANTQELLAISRSVCRDSYLISAPEQIDKRVLSPEKKIAVTAGASTPPQSVERVVRYLRNQFV